MCVGKGLISTPSAWMVPARTGSTPARVFISVVLPMPLAPRTPTISPRPTFKVSPRNTGIAP